MTPVQDAARSSFVLLHIGEHRFALPANLVTELAPPVRLHKFPHTSARVSGVIVRRGKIVPVYDPRVVFGGKRSSANLFYLIAECNFQGATELCAVPVNGECELISGEIHPRSVEAPEYVSGNVSVGAEQIDVLDLDTLVASNRPRSTDPALAGVRQ
jgi:chemotaxis signal transduction protein